GDYVDYYVGMIALHYGIHISDKDLGKYVKLHIDDGLNLLNEEISSNSNIDGFDFLAEKIETGLIKII
ncbi:DndE family protein, partial [Polaribacter sp.]|nr:DndE family protein [Polaribacter sp.]